MRLKQGQMRLASVLILLLAWELGGRLAGSRLFPPASAVFAALVDQALHGTLVHDLFVTLRRVALAFALAMGLGTALGVLMGLSRRADLALDSAVTLLLNLPAVVSIVLIYVWFGMGEGAAVVAVALNKLPSTAVTIREGARALDPALADMARSFRMSKPAVLRHVVWPQLTPYVFAAARSGLAIVWKIVLVAELLGRSDGVGFQIQVFFQTFDVTSILAYTLAFLLVVQALEWGVLQPMERRASRWRG